MEVDLAALLAQTILDRRQEINASRLAQGEPGRVELQVNLTVCRVDLQLLVREQAA